MHCVALRFYIDHRFVVAFLGEVAEDPLQKQEGEEVRVSPTWSIVEHAQVLLRHLIISYLQKTWRESRGFEVEDLGVAIRSLQFAEVLLRQVDKHLVINIASADNCHVFSKIHALVEPNNHISCNFVNVINFP